LPPGLGISNAEMPVGGGKIGGMPTALGSWTFTVEVRDPPTGTAYKRIAAKTFTIVIGAPEG
jgi:hypothetical protein